MKVLNYLLVALFSFNLFQIKAQCAASGSHYTASYPAGWNLTDLGDGNANLSSGCGDWRNGTIALSGTSAQFQTARDGRELRASRDIPVLSNTAWTMDFSVTINPSSYPAGILQTNSPSVVLAALASDQISLQSGCFTPPGTDFCVSCGAYPNTNMDAMWVYLTANPPASCSDNQAGMSWRIGAAARDGGGAQTASPTINIPSVAATYYIRLQRTNSGNAVLSVFSNSNFTGHLAGSPQCFSFSGSVTELDVLTHEVHSQGVCRRIFNGTVDNLKIDNNLSCPLALSPSFTISSTNFCGPQSFTVNGSASTSGTSIPISSHLWVVEECDANGNQFGPVWFGPGINGAPSGNYTIDPGIVANAGVNMRCGHYYKVSLVVMNCGNPWAATSKVIKINCPPSVKLTAPAPICEGDKAGLSTSITAGSGNYTITWQQISPWGGTIYNGPPASVSVHPSGTTTYEITVYDNVTGCSTTAQTIVTVASLDPTFSLLANTSNPSYFTIAASPNDLNGYSNAGFMYGHSIEELDPLNNPYYLNSSMVAGGTTCWWNYSADETFRGFVSLTGGNYTQLPGTSGCGPDGQFLYNHVYRITRLVVNDYCPSEQFSMIVSTNKLREVSMMEDPNAPDMMSNKLFRSPQELAEDEILISPNPSTGIFVIDMGVEAEESVIEVVNAFGQKVKTIRHSEGSRSELNLSGFAKGLYLVNITQGDGTLITKKIILE